MASDQANGIFKIKNVSGADYVIEELGGHVLADQAEVDLLDSELPISYGSYRDAERGASECAEAKLCQDITAGKLEVTQNQKPVHRRPS